MRKLQILCFIAACFSLHIKTVGQDNKAHYTDDLSKNYKQENSFRSKICLNGAWKVALEKNATEKPPVNENEYGYVMVPSSWLDSADFPITNTSHFSAGTWNGNGKWKGVSPKEFAYGWYVREFTVPQAWGNKPVILKFDRVTISGTIFVNGKKVGSQNERDEVEWDITSLVKKGKANKLAIRIAAFMDEEVKLFLGAEMTTKKKMKASLRGITQDVWLMTRPNDLHINDVFVKTSVRKNELSADVEVKNPNKAKGAVKVALNITSKKDGKLVKTIEADLNLKGKETEVLKLAAKWNDPVLWEVNDSYLYQATAAISKAGKVVDKSHKNTFGFKEFWIEGRNMVLNGKPFHSIALHIASHNSFTNAALKNAKKKIDLYRKAGYNSLQLGSEGVWHKGKAAQFYTDILNYADELGMPVFVPVAPVNAVNLDDDAERKNWEKIVRNFIRKYRNHPSVAMWSLNFNYLGYSWDMNPYVFGTDFAPADNILFLGTKRPKAQKSEDFVKTLDPSRTSYHHAGGNYGSMSTSNYYPGWQPLQEREDYMSKWAKEGIKPFFAVELGIPSTLDFLRARVGNYNTVRYSEVLEAEYSAPYLGASAFDKQTDAYLDMISSKATDKQSAGCDRYEVNQAYFWGQRLTLHDPIMSARAFIYPTYIRGWRTYGLSGYSPNAIRTDIMGKDWQPWHGVAGTYTYDDYTKPGAKPLTYYIPKENYELSKLGKVYAKAQRPVLIYLGGDKKNGFSAKDHAFTAGQKIEKQIVVVNDLRKDIAPVITIDMVDGAGKSISTQNITVKAKSGIREFKTVTFDAPAVSKRTDITFKLKVTGVAAKDLGLWDFNVQIFPKTNLQVKNKIALFDSVGDTAKAFKAAGINFTKLTKSTNLNSFDTIVIGRKSLKDSEALMKKVFKAVRSGKKLICFEQSDLTPFGLRVHKRGVRRAFKNSNSKLLKGLEDIDFSDWNGSSNMDKAYPKLSYKNQESYPTEAWKWGNKGVISSYMIEKPHIGNFKALLECEFDLGYTPLLQFKEGKGKITLCQLDVTNRLNSSPVARVVVKRMLNAKGNVGSSAKVYAYSDALKELLKKDGIQVATSPETKSVIVWKGDDLTDLQKNEIVTNVEKGGKLVLIGQKALNNCAWLPVQVKTGRKLFFRARQKGESDLTDGISTSDLFIKNRHVERVIKPSNGVTVLADPGIIAEAKHGKGQIVWFTVDPDQYLNPKVTPERMNRIRTKLKRIQSTLIANANGSFKDIGEKFLSADMLPNLDLPSKWQFSIDPKNKGRRKEWMTAEFDDSDWKTLNVPGYWEGQGITDKNRRFRKAKRPYDGYAWYRCKVFIPKNYKGKKLQVMLGAIDDMDVTYFNGEKIGSIGEETDNYYAAIRDYPIPANLIKFGAENTIAIRVFDNNGQGGIVGPKLYIHTVSSDHFPYLNSKTPFNPYVLKRW